MTRRKPRHRPTVKRRNKFGARMWWAECPCGWFQGEFEKGEAQTCAAEHLRQVST